MKDFLIIAAVCFGFLLIAILIFFPLKWGMEAYRCRSFGEMHGAPTKYVVLDTCYVEKDGSWFRRDQIRSAE